MSLDPFDSEAVDNSLLLSRPPSRFTSITVHQSTDVGRYSAIKEAFPHPQIRQPGSPVQLLLVQDLNDLRYRPTISHLHDPPFPGGLNAESSHDSSCQVPTGYILFPVIEEKSREVITAGNRMALVGALSH